MHASAGTTSISERGRPDDLPQHDDRGEEAGTEEDLDDPFASHDAGPSAVGGDGEAFLLGGVRVERHEA